MNNIVISKKIIDWSVVSGESKSYFLFSQHHAPKRPAELPAAIHNIKIKGESWIVLVGLLENKPYELFGGLSALIDLPKKYKSGILIKNGKDKDGISTYNLRIGEGEDQFLLKNIVELFANKLYGAFTRTISLALRHGTPAKYLVEQLSKDKSSDITSFSAAIARVLKNYVQDGDQSTEKCPECKNNLIFTEGCQKCLVCSYSKCQ